MRGIAVDDAALICGIRGVAVDDEVVLADEIKSGVRVNYALLFSSVTGLAADD